MAAATIEIYTLSLHDALPISGSPRPVYPAGLQGPARPGRSAGSRRPATAARPGARRSRGPACRSPCRRSEEHTSELQSHVNLVCRLLLEKKKRVMIHATLSFV